MGISKELIFLVIFSAVVIILFADIHEVTHQTINKYYGCDSNIIWDFLEPQMYQDMLDGKMPAFMHTTSYCVQSESQILAHSMNEVVGYNIMLILQIMFIFMVYTSISIIKNKNITIKLHKKRKGAPNVIILK